MYEMILEPWFLSNI
jgi:hypothetical protein